MALNRTEAKDRAKDRSDTRIKILVVDDEKAIIDILRSALELDNYKVLEAYDGEMALLKAQREAPDLILLDIMLPDITGYEICNKLRKNPLTGSIPIIMLTGMASAPDKMAGIGLGAVDYVTKPFDLNELKAKIRKVLQDSTS